MENVTGCIWCKYLKPWSTERRPFGDEVGVCTIRNFGQGYVVLKRYGLMDCACFTPMTEEDKENRRLEVRTW